MKLLKPQRLLALITPLLLLALLLSQGTSSHAQEAKDQPHVQKIIQRGVLRVGVKQDVPNFGYLNAKTQKFEGMEIDIAKKIAKELGVKTEFTPVTAQTRGPLLDNGQLDMVIATFTITEERRKLYNFSTPYYVDAVGFLVNKSSGIKTVEDLDGKTIGTALGAITQLHIKALAEKHGITVKFAELGAYPELAVSLRAHRIDAFSVDQSILSGYVSKRSEIMDVDFSASQYGIATKLDKKDLDSYISDLIDTWQANGQLEKIYNKYHLRPAQLEE